MSNHVNTSELKKETILQFLRMHKSFLKSQFGVNKIALFGSFARDEARADSDIDLLIEVETKIFKNRMKLRDFLAQEFGRDIEVGYFDALRSGVMDIIQKDLIYA